MFFTDLPNISHGPITSLGSQDDKINVPALWKHRLMFLCVVQADLPLKFDVSPGFLNWGSVREGFMLEDILELNV